VAVASCELLERAESLDLLNSLVAQACQGTGRLVLVSGEAGAGKTALLRRLAAGCDGSVRVLWGACDPLFTPRPLGPFVDLAEQLPGEFAELARQEARPHQMAQALLRGLSDMGSAGGTGGTGGTGRPAVVVLEDLHWADEASLDLFELIGRRIEQVPAVLVASFRDDEIDAAHPLRVVLGRLATVPGAVRLAVAPLSLDAVTALAGPAGADPRAVFDRTGGNPFFVTEVLSSGDGTIPPTVSDAVLARAARAGPDGVRLLQAIAIMPSAVDLGSLPELAGADAQHLDRCLASGVLIADDGRVRFRHELARQAVEQAIPPGRRARLHGAALRALTAVPGTSADPALLAHHAEQAGDAVAVLEFAPAAGDRAAAVGAHREAAGQYQRAVRFSAAAPLTVLARLHERLSYECYLSDQPDQAAAARRQALIAYRSLGDRRGEGESLCWLARLLFFASRDAEAEAAVRDAIGLLESLPASRELAMAYSTFSYMRLLAGYTADAISWGERAIAVADRIRDAEVLIHALNNVGTAEYSAGCDPGRDKLQRSLDLARAAGLTEHVVRAYVNLSSVGVDWRQYDLADRYLRDGIGYASGQGVDAWRWYLLAIRSRADFERGKWTEAAQTAGVVLAAARPTSFARLAALLVIARIKARRGEPGCGPLLDEAARIADLNGHLQLTGPVAIARAEVAWLDGAGAAIPARTQEAFDLASRLGDPWIGGELACWRRRAGLDEPAPGELAEPFALQLAGKNADAAGLWLALGCPYEAALALADGDDESSLRRALRMLQQLRAQRAAAIVARRLRALGVRGLPRGPRRSTARNPAGLTDRELEVLALMAGGQSNADIAARLALSRKTVEHHASAIFRKLRVSSRRDLPNLGDLHANMGGDPRSARKPWPG
jgi:DNA-binding CsgD family transcriptional regulator/tetratricopeptide (TPR) repeat protein